MTDRLEPWIRREAHQLDISVNDAVAMAIMQRAAQLAEGAARALLADRSVRL